SGISSASSSPTSRWRSPASSSTSSTSRGGMPRSVTAISPTASEAGGKTCATLGAAKVTVRSASTWGPIGCASLPERPLGRATAGDQKDPHLPAAHREMAGDRQAVPSVVARTAEDRRRLRLAERLPDRLDDADGGVLHQHQAGDPQLLDGGAVDLAHGFGGEN